MAFVLTSFVPYLPFFSRIAIFEQNISAWTIGTRVFWVYKTIGNPDFSELYKTIINR